MRRVFKISVTDRQLVNMTEDQIERFDRLHKQNPSCLKMMAEYLGPNQCYRIPDSSWAEGDYDYADPVGRDIESLLMEIVSGKTNNSSAIS